VREANDDDDDVERVLAGRNDYDYDDVLFHRQSRWDA